MDNYNYRGIEYLRSKLATIRPTVLKKYEYYEMNDHHQMPRLAIPKELSYSYKSQLGWCAKAVDSLADRLVVNGFENDRMNMKGIFDLNNSDILFDSAILGALISACDFIYISKNEDDTPRLQVIHGGNATGVLDPVTNMLMEGYAVLERDPETETPLVEAYFIAGRTDYYVKGKEPYSINNVATYPLLVPVINRPDSRKEFGHSRISRSCIDYQDKAKDVLTRAAVTAEFYSYPQKYVLGLSEEAEAIDTFRATVSSMLRFDRDEDGNTPSLGQFSQQSMQPHIEHFKMYASNFAGETGLTLDDLGFVQANPSSAEAIKSSHETLRVIASKAQRTFGIGFLNAGYLACCIRDNQPYKRSAVFDTKLKWKPIIEPDAAMLSAIGDGAIKINQAIPDYFSKETLEDLTGISAAKE